MTNGDCFWRLFATTDDDGLRVLPTSPQVRHSIGADQIERRDYSAIRLRSLFVHRICLHNPTMTRTNSRHAVYIQYTITYTRWQSYDDTLCTLQWHLLITNIENLPHHFFRGAGSCIYKFLCTIIILTFPKSNFTKSVLANIILIFI